MIVNGGKRYVIDTDMNSELGTITKNGKKIPFLTFNDFMMNVIDDAFFEDDLFNYIKKLWAAGMDKDDVMTLYTQKYNEIYKKHYESLLSLHANMRKKSNKPKLKLKTKRTVTKRGGK